MPTSVSEELKNETIADSDDQAQLPAPVNGEQSSSEEEPEPVQTGSVSDADQSELLEDPKADDSSEKSFLESRKEAYLTQARKPFQKTELPVPGQDYLAYRKEAYLAAANKPFEKPETQIQVRKGIVEETKQKLFPKTGTTGKPLPPIPTKSESATTGKPLPPIPTKSESATTGKPLPPIPTKSESATTGKPQVPTESESAEPAQETDPYALLKRDVNSLSEAEKQERANLLKQKYVDEWKQKKEKENEELSKDLTDDEESKEETGQSKDTPKASMKKKLLGGFDNLMEKGGTKVEDFIDSKKDAESEKTRNTAQIASGAWGMFSNSYSLFRSHQKSKQKRKKGDSIGAGLERFNMFSNLFGIAAGGTDAARGIAGFKGNDTASPCNERGGLMSFTLSVVGNKSKALFALSVGENISTYIIITPTTRFVIGVIIIMTLVLLLTLLFLFL